MKRILAFVAIVFAFALSSQAQLNTNLAIYGRDGTLYYARDFYRNMLVNGNFRREVVADDAGTATTNVIDASLASFQTINLTTNATIVLSNIVAGSQLDLLFWSSTQSNQVSFASGIQWGGNAVTNVLSGKRTLVQIRSTGTNATGATATNVFATAFIQP